MQRFPGNPVEEIEEIRDLLLGREREELRDLRDQITKKERRSDDVAAILPEAVKLSRSRGDQLSRALRPVLERSIEESIRKRPETLVDILHPILGSIVRRSVAERVRRFFKSFSLLSRIFSWQGMKCRFEALRTGETFAEVIKRRNLVYRVEQVFLIHRETGLPLFHIAANSGAGDDLTATAGMLSAIHDFARGSFGMSGGSSLVEFRFRQMQVWIALERYAYLAAIIRGNPSTEVRSTLKETIESIHVLKESALAKFTGDTDAFESLRPDLESCLLSQYGGPRSRGRIASGQVILAAAAAAIVFVAAHMVSSELHWKNFLARLNAQPGLVVTEAHKGWFSPSSVSGLRDPSSNEPVVIAREEKLDPSAIRFHWKSYLALDPATIMERFKRRFSIPPTTRAAVSDGVLTLSGPAPYEWLERVRREAASVPGIVSVADRGVEVIYDPGFILKRFQQEFGLPPSVHPLLAKSVLTLSGEAPHRWLTRVRADVTKIPGIASVDERNMVDLDQRTFQQSKSALESTFVHFVENKDDISTEGFVVLSRLPDQINRLANAARQVGLDVKLEILGYPGAGALADQSNNADLGQRRANKVRDFLVSCGLDSAGLKPLGIETSPKSSGEKSGSEQSDGYATFKVVSEGPSVSR